MRDAFAVRSSESRVPSPEIAEVMPMRDAFAFSNYDSRIGEPSPCCLS